MEVVSFELAKKLKEKGFPQRPDNFNYSSYYEWDGLRKIHSLCSSIVWFDPNICRYNLYFAPTISQVLKWLREEKVISVEPYSSASGWRVTICRAYHQGRTDTGRGTWLKSEVEGYNNGGAFEKYEEAALAGIKCCLDNMTLV